MSAASTYDHVFVAEGAFSVVFSYQKKTYPFVRFAVKFNKHPTWDSRGITLKRIMSADVREIDTTLAAWYILAVTGMSPHVPRPYGVLPFGFDKTALPYSSVTTGIKTDGLMMEFMAGLMTKDGRPLSDLKAAITAGIANELEDFETILPVIVFQVLYTVAAWNEATNAGFRHNDLHAANVCITYWNPEHTPVKAEYRLRDDLGVDRVFTIESPYCAAVVDFGTAAILPHAGGVCFDPRFYYFKDAMPERLIRDPKEIHGIREAKFVKWGLSHREPSRHYDSCLFMFAVLASMGRKEHPASSAFRKFYSRNLGNIHLSTRLMFRKECGGRLVPAAQRQLMQNKPVSIGKTQHLIPDAAGLLMDEYFAAFRSGSSTCGAMSFGLNANAAGKSEAMDTASRTVSTLSANPHDANWKPVLDSRGFLLNPTKSGVWSSLMSKLDAIRTSKVSGTAMTEEQLRAWAPKAFELAVSTSLEVSTLEMETQDADDADLEEVDFDFPLMSNL
jgi:hypothetical protein